MVVPGRELDQPFLTLKPPDFTDRVACVQAFLFWSREVVMLPRMERKVVS